MSDREERSNLSPIVDKFTLNFDGKAILTVLLGLILFFIVFFFLDNETKNTLRSNPESSYLWITTKLTTFLSGLIYFLICAVLGNKTADRKYEFDRKYISIKPVLYFLLFLLFASLGFMAGVVLIIASIL